MKRSLLVGACSVAMVWLPACRDDLHTGSHDAGSTRETQGIAGADRPRDEPAPVADAAGGRADVPADEERAETLWVADDSAAADTPVLLLADGDVECEVASPDGGPPVPAAQDAGIDAGLEARAATDGGTAPSGATVKLGRVSVWAGCKQQHPYPNDPIVVSWTAEVTGASGAQADFATGTLDIVKGATTITQTLMVDDPAIPLTGGAGSATQWKSVANFSPNNACTDVCGGTATYRLDLVYLVDGRSIPVSSSGVLTCSY